MSNHQARKAAQAVVRLLNEGRAKPGLSLHAFFTQSLRVWDATVRHVEMDEFLNVACVGVEKAIAQIGSAFDVLCDEATDNYDDILGMVYMLAELGGKGEEYTPFDLARLLIRINMANYPWPKLGDKPITIYDPCCGSGSLLLATAEYIDEVHPELLDTGMVHFYGQDASYDAWQMTRLNLHLHHLGRCIRRSSSLPSKGQEAMERGMNTPPLIQAALPFSIETEEQSGQRLRLFLANSCITQRPRVRLKRSLHRSSPLFVTTEPLFDE